METEVSEYALIAIISIMTEKKKIYLVEFHSCIFKAIKFNYNMRNKELLAVFKVFYK